MNTAILYVERGRYYPAMDQFYRTAVALIYILTTWTTFNVNGDNAIVVARQGTRTILSCVAQNKINDVATLSWIRTSGSTDIVVFTKFEDGRLVFPRPHKYSVSYFYQLEILNANASDAGSYRCDYRIAVSVTSRTTELYVPDVYIEECIDVPESTCRVDGSLIDSLTCKFSGFPADILVSWQRTPGDGAVLVERRFNSSRELVTTYDKERENSSFVCRVTDGSRRNSSRFAPFEQAVQFYVSGYAYTHENKKDPSENTPLIVTVTVIGVVIALLIIINVIVIIRWKRRALERFRAMKQTHKGGYSKKDMKADEEGQHMEILDPEHGGNSSQAKTWKLKTTVALSAADSMKCMAATPDGMMAVGCTGGECGIEIYTANGQLHRKALQGVNVHGIGFLSNGRCVVDSTRPATDETIIRVSLYTQDWDKVDDKEFESMIWDDDGSNDLTVDSEDHIYVCKKNEKILVFPPKGKKPIREIKCNWYTPDQIFAMQFSKKVVVKDSESALMINESGDVQQKLTETNGSSVYPAVRKDDTILIATVSKERDRVTVERYTSVLKYEATLIKDHVIEKSDKHYYYLQEFTSGEIAFCTPNRLYIFSDGV